MFRQYDLNDIHERARAAFIGMAIGDALGATVEGATTLHWLMDRLAPYTAPQGTVTVSRVAQGVPMGGALDVLDDGTLAAALGARRPA